MSGGEPGYVPPDHETTTEFPIPSAPPADATAPDGAFDTFGAFDADRAVQDAPVDASPAETVTDEPVTEAMTTVTGLPAANAGPMPSRPPEPAPPPAPSAPSAPKGDGRGRSRALAGAAVAAVAVVGAGAVVAVLMGGGSGTPERSAAATTSASAAPTATPATPSAAPGVPAPSASATPSAPSASGGPTTAASGAPSAAGARPTMGVVMTGNGITHRLVQRDEGYYEGELLIANRGSAPMANWTVTFAAPGADVKNVWGGRLARRGSAAEIVAAEPIPPGETLEVRYGAAGEAVSPQGCRLNGRPCGF